MPLSDMITTNEVARILGVSPGTLRRKRSEGVETLPHTRVGSMDLYECLAVERAVERAR